MKRSLISTIPDKCEMHNSEFKCVSPIHDETNGEMELTPLNIE